MIAITLALASIGLFGAHVSDLYLSSARRSAVRVTEKRARR